MIKRYGFLLFLIACLALSVFVAVGYREIEESITQPIHAIVPSLPPSTKSS